MVKKLSLMFLAASVLQFPALLPAQEKADKRDLLAKDTAEQFLAAVWKQDIETAMRTVDVPFFFNGRETIKDRGRLKTGLESMFSPPLPQVEQKVRAIYSFGSLPSHFFSNKDHELLAKLLEKTDRIVLLQLPRRLIAIAVRFQDTKAKVVGIRFPLPPLTLFIVAQEQEKGDKRTQQAKEAAKETVLRFLKTAKAKDLDSLAKLADVPWYSDGNRIIKDRDDLKKILKSTWVDLVDQGRPLPTDVNRTTTYGEIREQFKEPRRELADQVFAKDDWAVFVGGPGKQRGGVLFVRVREGKGKVIGVAQ